MEIDSDNEVDEEKIDGNNVLGGTNKLPDSIGGWKIIQLKNNYISCGLVPLEKLFGSNDVVVGPSLQPHQEDVKELKLSTLEDPRVVKISEVLACKKGDKIN
jgi:hypothetical protein